MLDHRLNVYGRWLARAIAKLRQKRRVIENSPRTDGFGFRANDNKKIKRAKGKRIKEKA
jgi:hypothetical protein